MPKQYLTLSSSGLPATKSATAVSAGSANGGDIVALTSAGLLDLTIMPAGIGATVVSATASAAISAGQLVNLYNNSGTLTAKPADNTTPAQADAYATAGVASGAVGTFNLQYGLLTGLSGLTVGAQQFLGTNGGVTATAPTATGSIVQPVGKAISASSVEFQPGTPVTIGA